MKKNGFTLLEMAIVLLIIGLLAAGLVTARSMIDRAVMRNTIAEVDKYSKAIQLFQEKYGQLPGDFNNAQAYWGVDPGGCPAAFNTVHKRETCNGDGNGTIGSWDGSSFSAMTEWYRAWQHLADAGFIDGDFTGVGGNVAGGTLRGNAVPVSVYPGGAYMLMFFYAGATADTFAMTGKHLLAFGDVDAVCATGGSSANCITRAPFMAALDAQELDMKLDDGRPGLGRVMARPDTTTVTPTCVTGTDPNTATYNVSGNGTCAPMIDTGY